MQVAADLLGRDAVLAGPAKPGAATGMWPSSTISARAGTCSITPASPTDESTTSVRLPRSRPANWYSDSVSGTGVTAPSIVAGSAPSATAIGNGWPGLGERELAEVERAAAVREPAHDDLVRPDDLLPVDAEVLARRAPGPPCGPRVITRPQVISGPASSGQQVCTGSEAEVDVRPLEDDLLADGAANPGRLHVPQRLGHL